MAIVRAANTRVFERALEDPTVAGMGTTATVALVDEQAGTIALAQVGDSRAYRYRDGALEQLTTDHSLVGELVRLGRLTEDEAAVHPHRSVITRALGTEPDVDVDTSTVDVAAGDLILLCSDGLSAMVRDDEIARVLEASGDPGAAPRARAGGERRGRRRQRDRRPLRARRGRADPARPRDLGRTNTEIIDLEHTEEDVTRHGAGKGSRWPALLFVVALLALTALVLWWGFLK